MLQRSFSHKTAHERNLNHLSRSAGSGDFLFGRLTEFVGAYLQFPGQISLAQNLNPTLYTVDETGLGQLFDAD
jgi:hypothetical protein